MYDTLGSRIRARDGVTTDSGVTLTSHTNSLNQHSALSEAVRVSPTYDLDGNQLTGVLPTNPGTPSGYTWNANNELSVVKSGNPLTTLATYQYDPLGRRMPEFVPFPHQPDGGDGPGALKRPLDYAARFAARQIRRF